MQGLFSPRNGRSPQWAFAFGMVIVSVFLPQLGCNRVKPETKTDPSPAKPIAGPAPDAAVSGNLPGASNLAAQTPNYSEAEQSGLSSHAPAIPFDPSTGIKVDRSDDTSSMIGGGLPQLADSADELTQRSFATLQPTDTDDPAELLSHITDVDAALRDLVVDGSRSRIDDETFKEGGLRLGKMKLSAARRLSTSDTASAHQRKSGQIATLVALSHLSGLQDVESARMLNRYAGELSKSDDADLAHQGRVVLLGFEVQALQSGQASTPDDLLNACRLVLDDPKQRNFPEFIAIENAANVMQSMGFSDAAQQTVDLLATAYAQSRDNDQRGRAWMYAIRNSTTAQSFFQLLTAQFQSHGDPHEFITTARALADEFPTGATLEKLTATLAELESNHASPASVQLAKLIRKASKTASLAEFQSTAIEKLLAAHDARQALVGQTLDLGAVTTFNDQPLSMADYKGKVVLVEFWASWCPHCNKEIPFLRKNYESYSSQGLEIIGVNMDSELENGKAFVTRQAFPWANVHSSDLNALGFDSPTAQRLGVSQIPFSILIDRDGKISELHVRGDAIAERVELLLAQ